MKKVQPKIAFIGVGAKNTFGHPNQGVLDRLKEIGAKIYRTDINGEIEITINQKRRDQNKNKNRERRCVKGEKGV